MEVKTMYVDSMEKNNLDLLNVPSVPKKYSRVAA